MKALRMLCGLLALVVGAEVRAQSFEFSTNTGAFTDTLPLPSAEIAANLVINGRLLDTSDAPIADAEIFVEDGIRRASVFVGMTDAAGEFSYPIVASCQPPAGSQLLMFYAVKDDSILSAPVELYINDPSGFVLTPNGGQPPSGGPADIESDQYPELAARCNALWSSEFYDLSEGQQTTALQALGEQVFNLAVYTPAEIYGTILVETPESGTLIGAAIDFGEAVTHGVSPTSAALVAVSAVAVYADPIQSEFDQMNAWWADQIRDSNLPEEVQTVLLLELEAVRIRQRSLLAGARIVDALHGDLIRIGLGSSPFAMPYLWFYDQYIDDDEIPWQWEVLQNGVGEVIAVEVRTRFKLNPLRVDRGLTTGSCDQPLPESALASFVFMFDESSELTLDVIPDQTFFELGSSIELRATLTDSDGTPLEDIDIQFSQLCGGLGVWETAGGAQLPGPDNGPTDALGRRRTYFSPQSTGVYCFAATDGSSTQEVQVSVANPSGAEVSIDPPSSGTRTPDYAEYSITARFMTDSGALIQNGCARFTTSRGEWREGPGFGTDTTLEDIGSAAAATAKLRIFDCGPTTITVELCSTDADCGPSVGSCSGTGDLASAIFTLCIDDAPRLQPSFTFTGLSGGDLEALASDGETLGAVERNQRFLAWDLFTLEQVCEISGNDRWDTADALAMSRSNKMFYAFGFNDGIGVFDLNTCLADSCGDQLRLHNDASARPDGSRAAVLEEVDGARDKISIHDDGGCQISSTFIGPSGSETMAYGISWSPHVSTSSQLIAVTYRLDPDGDDLSYVQLYRATNLSTFGSPIQIGEGRPGDVEWSNDASLFAVHDGDETILFFNDSGNTGGAPPPINSDSDGGPIKWSHDDSMIAFHRNDSNVVVFSIANGQPLIRLAQDNAREGENTTIAWRSDDQVLASTAPDSPEIKLFAPFDSDPPSIDVVEPVSGASVEHAQDSIALSGFVTDDSAIIPGTCQLRVNGSPWTELPRDPSGAFSELVLLNVGTNLIDIRATDLRDRTAQVQIVVVREDLPPVLTVGLSGGGPLDGSCDSAPVDLGVMLVGQSGASVGVEVAVSGGGGVSFGPLLPPAGFQVAGDLSPALLAGQSDVFIIQPDSSAAGSFDGCVTFTTSLPELPEFGIPVTVDIRCNAADTAPPYGELDFDDVLLFLNGFSECNELVDIAPAFGVCDFDDVLAFLTAFGAGCP